MKREAIVAVASFFLYSPLPLLSSSPSSFCHPGLDPGSSVFGLCLFPSSPRHPMAPPQGACGRGCAPVPNSMWRRGLFERSEFRSPNNRDRGKGTRRATPGRPWFWVLLPKQKDLVVRGRNPASTSLLLSSSTLVPDLIGDPVKERIQRLFFVFVLCSCSGVSLSRYSPSL